MAEKYYRKEFSACINKLNKNEINYVPSNNKLNYFVTFLNQVSSNLRIEWFFGGAVKNSNMLNKNKKKINLNYKLVYNKNQKEIYHNNLFYKNLKFCQNLKVN